MIFPDGTAPYRLKFDYIKCRHRQTNCDYEQKGGKAKAVQKKKQRLKESVNQA